MSSLHAERTTSECSKPVTKSNNEWCSLPRSILTSEVPRDISRGEGVDVLWLTDLSSLRCLNILGKTIGLKVVTIRGMRIVTSLSSGSTSPKCPGGVGPHLGDGVEFADALRVCYLFGGQTKRQYSCIPNIFLLLRNFCRFYLRRGA